MMITSLKNTITTDTLKMIKLSIQRPRMVTHLILECLSIPQLVDHTCLTHVLSNTLIATIPPKNGFAQTKRPKPLASAMVAIGMLNHYFGMIGENVVKVTSFLRLNSKKIGYLAEKKRTSLQELPWYAEPKIANTLKLRQTERSTRLNFSRLAPKQVMRGNTPCGQVASSPVEKHRSTTVQTKTTTTTAL